MAKRLEGEPITPSPGPRKQVTLDVSQYALPTLIEGVACKSVELHPNEDGSYTLRTTGVRVGDTRDMGFVPAADKLVQLMNQFSGVLEQHDDELPEAVKQAWDATADEWSNWNGELSEGSDG